MGVFKRRYPTERKARLVYRLCVNGSASAAHWPEQEVGEQVLIDIEVKRQGGVFGVHEVRRSRLRFRQGVPGVRRSTKAASTYAGNVRENAAHACLRGISGQADHGADREYKVQRSQAVEAGTVNRELALSARADQAVVGIPEAEPARVVSC